MNRVNSPSQNSRTSTTETNKPIEADQSFACSECKTNDVTRTQDGEVICGECSAVLSTNKIDRRPSRNAFPDGDGKDTSRTGMPITEERHDKGLTTDISWQNRDSNGNSLSTRKRRQMNRLRIRHKRAKTKDGRERTLRQAFGEINRMSSALGVPKNVREISCVLYRRAQENNLIVGRSIEGMASSALYAGCLQAGVPRGLSEVANVSRVPEIQVSRAYRYMLQELSLEIEPVNPKEHIPRYCSALNVSNELEQKANEVVDKTAEAGLASGKSPTGFAAAAIYTASLICGENVTQQQIADVANTTTVTIRSRYQEQMEVID